MKKLTLSFLLALFFAVPVTINAQTSAKAKDAALGSIGMLAGHSVYNTYIVIGSIADSYGTDTYTTTYMKQLIQEQVDMIDNLDSTFIALNSSGFITSESDKESVAEIREIYRLLKKQANALIAYIDSGGTEDSDYFQECRKKSWEAISKFLGIEE